VERVAHELPSWLTPVLAFLNSVDVEAGSDDLAAGPTALSSWLVAHGLLTADGAEATRAEHRLALDLRAGLRALALQNNRGPSDQPAVTRMRRVLQQLPLVAEVDPAKTGMRSLRPYRSGPVRAALGVLVAGYAQAVGTGEWTRIRRCPAEDCAWAFWDSSAKGTRRWCSMRVCGNRAKVRAFAERKARRP
jgi:predicted RNA-binding Zn ribbon-like protein